MNIKYLKSFQDNISNLRGSISRGLNIEEITFLEEKLNNGNSFPKALKEYLYLGGDYNPLGFDSEGIGYDEGKNQYLALIEFYEKKMKQKGVSINKPYFILSSLHGECFTFIYLDEGDDPQPYNFGVDEDYRSENGEIIFNTPQNSFSELVDVLVDRALKGLTPF